MWLLFTSEPPAGRNKSNIHSINGIKNKVKQEGERQSWLFTPNHFIFLLSLIIEIENVDSDGFWDDEIAYSYLFLKYG